MNKFNVFSIVALLSLNAGMQAMDVDNKDYRYSGCTSDGIPLTEETLHILAQERSPMPAELEEQVNTWATTPKNLALIKTLTKRPELSYKGFTTAIESHRQLLVQDGLIQPNQSTGNYVFKPTSDASYFIKIAGAFHKLYTLISSTGINPYAFANETTAKIKAGELPANKRPFDYFDYSKMDPNVQTHQTMSRMARYLKVKEAVTQRNMENVSAIPTHLWHIPGQDERSIDDNYIVIKQEEKDAIAFRNLDARSQDLVLKNLSEQTMQELHHAIAQGALWDVGSNFMIRKSNINQIVLQDFEQPNNTDEHFFFYQGEYVPRFFGNVGDGVAGIAQKLKPYESQYNKWMHIVQSDAEYIATREASNKAAK